MELIKGLSGLGDAHRPSVATIGNFDGVHLGHQAVIKSLLTQSELLSAPSTVITFEPLAKEFFMPNKILRLSTIEDKADMLFSMGVDRVLCIEFNKEFAESSAQDFIKEVLVDSLGIKYLSVGDDFKFGKGRSGDFNLLQISGLEHGFETCSHETFEIDGKRVSSGRVREALIANDLALVKQLIGRSYAISGTVIKGQQLGRTLGFPTANILLPDNMIGVNGVYVVQAFFPDDKGISTPVNGVANVGQRPTVDGKENRLEVNLFDVDMDLYGKKMQVHFLNKIREVVKFDSLDALKNQIAQDVIDARAFFAK